MSRLFTFDLETRKAAKGHVSWQKTATVSVYLQRLRSRPMVRQGAEMVLLSHHVRLRFRADVDIGMRFRNDKRVLVIHQLETTGRRNGWLSCLCEEQRVLNKQAMG